ncbi:MAG: protein translocase subunit SecD [Proteobacteria bacterium]|nr:protein translocase subunit SecD [Pseudomonadota bacterium]
MNRYPLWKYILILTVVIVGAFYALPNIYGRSPVVQMKAEKNQKLEAGIVANLEASLKANDISYLDVNLEDGSVVVRFEDLDNQRLAQDLFKVEFDQHKSAMNLRPNVPDWLESMGGSAMNLGLDLRGGVHLQLEVDMNDAAKNKKKQIRSDITALLIKKRIPKRRISWVENKLEITFKSAENAEKAYDELKSKIEDLSFKTDLGVENKVTGLLTDATIQEFKQKALEQNLTTLRSRINEVGVAEPIVQRQGVDRIVIQLPGLQDPSQVKDILKATATLEYRATDMENNALQAMQSGVSPIGSSLYYMRDGAPILLKDRVIVTGNQLTDAQSGFDQSSGTPMVSVKINTVGAARMLEFTKNNINKLMAVVYKESIPVGKKENGDIIYKKTEEVINNATIRGVFSNAFQTTGLDSADEAFELALLLRAGALAAPVQIVEERTIGPSLGQDNIDKGMLSVQIGFVLVLIFMLVYYRMFGLIANIALTVNLVLITAFLSIFGATLTLPGIAGIVLTVGMAVDANVLIFERIKEELRLGNTIQGSIKAGYEKAFSTIADANVTTFIAAIVLFAFGTGPIKGFAVTLSIGIITSMFTAIMLSRAIVNLIYGRKKRLTSISI